jgi:hypothetical protein
MAAKRTSGNNPPEGLLWVGIGCQNEFVLLAVRRNAVSRKGHEIVAVSFFTKNHSAALIVFPTILLLVEFVLCQGESGSGASLGACNRDSSMGSLSVLTDNRSLRTDHWFRCPADV